eukprot:TRINITY_DN6311_c0_g1_i1.p1 TRINITY_DN6311_c0_g1~~TRINITY_DN6311_c0_g1_i1.p1  ORF type:complete len:235 (+),score=87.92 TRINITY_DN6311_c0_g1_i1:92-706(+)
MGLHPAFHPHHQHPSMMSGNGHSSHSSSSNSGSIPPPNLSEFQRRMSDPSSSHRLDDGVSSSSSPHLPFPTEALSRKGVSFKHLHVQSDLLIPTNIPESPVIPLKKGQRVMIIRTAKGIYIRLGDQIIKIKLPPEMLKELSRPSPEKEEEVVTLSDSEGDNANTNSTNHNNNRHKSSDESSRETPRDEFHNNNGSGGSTLPSTN